MTAISIDSRLFHAMKTTHSAETGSITIHFGFGHCLLGDILVAQSNRGLCAVLPGDNPAALWRDLRRRFPTAILVEGGEVLKALSEQVSRFIDEPTTAHLDQPLDLHGTDFEQRVWWAIREIPVGQTASYCDVAKRIGLPDRAREVAQACAANSLAVIVPCHRVMKNMGSLSGYRWGGYRKRALLRHEAIVLKMA